MVRQAFVEHARYYLEMLRIPHTSIERGTEMVTVDDWDRWEPLLQGGAVVATLPPRSGENPITFAALPPLPWLVEARSPRERVLVSMPVNEGGPSGRYSSPLRQV